MKVLPIIVVYLLIGLSASATHLKGGYIRVEKTTGLTYNIIVTVYTNTINTNVLFGGDDDILDFGDGTSMSIPEQQNILLEDGTTIARFEVLHTYAGAGRYLVSYSEPNRSEAIVNIDASVNTRLYLEASFLADPFVEYGSPEFLTPIFITTAGSSYSYGVTGNDPNDYTLLYSVSTPKNTFNYQFPETFKVNKFNGLVTWDGRFQGSPAPVGEYLFNIRITQMRDGTELGYIIVDFQIQVEDVENSLELVDNLELDPNNRLYVPVNDQETFKVFFDDTVDGDLSLDVYSEISESLTFSSYDSVHDGNNVKVGVITIDHSPEITRTNPYAITLRGSSVFGEEEKILSKDISILLYTEDVDLAEEIVATQNDDESSLYALYPNPFSERVSLAAPGTENARVTIRTVTNTVIYDEAISNGSIINLDNTNSSVLIYQISTGKNVYSGKILKR
jgi:hypothetical protein